jgi:hypothetical protein
MSTTTDRRHISCDTSSSDEDNDDDDADGLTLTELLAKQQQQQRPQRKKKVQTQSTVPTKNKRSSAASSSTNKIPSATRTAKLRPKRPRLATITSNQSSSADPSNNTTKTTGKLQSNLAAFFQPRKLNEAIHTGRSEREKTNNNVAPKSDAAATADERACITPIAAVAPLEKEVEMHAAQDQDQEAESSESEVEVVQETANEDASSLEQQECASASDTNAAGLTSVSEKEMADTYPSSSLHLRNILYGQRMPFNVLRDQNGNDSTSNIMTTLLQRSLNVSSVPRGITSQLAGKLLLSRAANAGICQTVATSTHDHNTTQQGGRMSSGTISSTGREGYITSLSFDPTAGGVLLALTTSRGVIKIYDVDELQHLDHTHRRSRGRQTTDWMRQRQVEERHRKERQSEQEQHHSVQRMNEGGEDLASAIHDSVAEAAGVPPSAHSHWKPIMQFRTPDGFGIQNSKWNPRNPDELAMSFM